MPTYKVVDAEKLDQDMTSVADKIRDKAGISLPLEWPTGYEAAVDAIQSGGKAPSVGFVPTEWDEAGYITSGKWYGETLPAYAFMLTTNTNIVNRLVSIEFEDEITSIPDHAFHHSNRLVTIHIPDSVTSIGLSAFYGCSKLALASLPSDLTSLGQYAFRSCSTMTPSSLPSGVTIIPQYCFGSCSAIPGMDCKGVTSIEANAFYGCSKLAFLVLRSETVCTLSNTNALTSTPIKSGTGYIYVPSALLESYQAATNWSTYSAQFRALEDYTVDGTITGALDETKI